MGGWVRRSRRRRELEKREIYESSCSGSEVSAFRSLAAGESKGTSGMIVEMYRRISSISFSRFSAIRLRTMACAVNREDRATSLLFHDAARLTQCPGTGTALSTACPPAPRAA